MKKIYFNIFYLNKSVVILKKSQWNLFVSAHVRNADNLEIFR